MLVGEKDNRLVQCIMSGNTEVMEKRKAEKEIVSMEGEGRGLSLDVAGWESPLQSCLVSHAKKCALNFKAKGVL